MRRSRFAIACQSQRRRKSKIEQPPLELVDKRNGGTCVRERVIDIWGKKEFGKAGARGTAFPGRGKWAGRAFSQYQCCLNNQSRIVLAARKKKKKNDRVMSGLRCRQAQIDGILNTGGKQLHPDRFEKNEKRKKR